ncbi:hypothetical protein [Chryseobacterium sp. 5_R23647]|uniref:hypothetical protein n=1 Tax=Chryseobacterium sp. 5_R23647 TaxID=2258964 RepID=UPI000E287BA3|nr:hypothetical protein [Chryseobacterium sp. 5_R23647]REC40519.1 hypothetical protein DRF69_18670 [Chryseobacterium sp. 5_R23647]
MALDNFFKINFPYGIKVNNKGEWTAFNREYKPLGYSDSKENVTEKDFKYCKYKNLTPTILRKLGDHDGAVEKENDKIVKVFLYNDGSNPSNFDKKDLYNKYFAKLEILSKLKKA